MRKIRSVGMVLGIFSLGAMLAACGSTGSTDTPEDTADQGSGENGEDSAEDTTDGGESSGSDLAALVPQTVRDRGVLRVAVPDGSPPLSSVNASGEPEGMDPDLAAAIADLLNLELELTAGTFDSQIPGLQADRYDLAMGEYYVTAERLESVDFVAGWRDFSSFATAADGDYDPQTGADLCGMRIGVMRGAAEEASVTDFNSANCDESMDIQSFSDMSSSVLALSSGRIDAVVNGRGQLEQVAEQQPDIKVGGEFGGGPTAVAVARTDYSAEMLEAVKAAYDQLIQDGTYLEILETWSGAYGAVDTAEIYTQDSTPPDYSAS